VGVGVGVGSRRRCSCGEYANVINVLLVLPPVRVELLAATFAAQVTPPLALTFTWWLMNGFSSLPSVELTSGFWIFNRAWRGWREGLRIADGWQPDQPSRQPPSHTLRRAVCGQRPVVLVFPTLFPSLPSVKNPFARRGRGVYGYGKPQVRRGDRTRNARATLRLARKNAAPLARRRADWTCLLVPGFSDHRQTSPWPG